MLYKPELCEELEKCVPEILNKFIDVVCKVAEEATYWEAELEEQKTQAQQLQQARENLGGRIAETVQVGNSLNTSSVS